MDTVTHLVAGALTPIAFKSTPKRAALVVFGILAGELPDIDIFFGGTPSALFTLHRGITHALLWQPVMALMLVFPFFIWMSRSFDASTGSSALPCSMDSAGQGASRLGRFSNCAISGTGMGMLFLMALFAQYTHLYLDCMTTFGTQIFLPFSNVRVALPGMFIVDLLETVPAGIILIVALRQKPEPLCVIADSTRTVFRGAVCADRLAPWAIAGVTTHSSRARRLARAGLVWMLVYPLLSFGIGQAVVAALSPQLAPEPGSRLSVLTEPFSPFVWKLVGEEADGKAFRMGTLFLTSPRVVEWTTFSKPDARFTAKLRQAVPLFEEYMNFCPTLVEVVRPNVATGGGRAALDHVYMDLRYVISSHSPARMFGRTDTNFVFEAREAPDGGIVASRFLNRGRNTDTPWVLP